MALSKSNLKDLIKTELNAISWDGSENHFKYAGEKSYETYVSVNNETGEIENLSEFQAEVYSYSIIDHFQDNAEITVTGVESGTDEASGTLE